MPRAHRPGATLRGLTVTILTRLAVCLALALAALAGLRAPGPGNLPRRLSSCQAIGRRGPWQLAGLTGERLTGERLTGERLTGERLTGERLTGERLTGELPGGGYAVWGGIGLTHPAYP